MKVGTDVSCVKTMCICVKYFDSASDSFETSVLIYFKFLEWVLTKFVNLNKLFQSDKPVIWLVYSKMSIIYTDILYSYMRRLKNLLLVDFSI